MARTPLGPTSIQNFRWLGLVPPDRFTVVVVPQSGSDPRLLWDRFLTAINVSGDGTTLAEYRNQSMGATSTKLMRAVAKEAADLSSFDRRLAVRWGLAKQILTKRSSFEPHLAITPAQQSVLKARAIEMTNSIVASGVRVIGDLDELIPADDPRPGVHPGEITEAQLLEAAVFGLAAMCRQSARDQAEIAALKEQVASEQ